ncbi:MAG: dihydroorotase [Gammaproteobacteria bacterium]|nr:dihydroorotase [Gammaproteobacteria bacterium]
MNQLQITLPDDWHLHLRDAESLKTTVPATARCFGRAIIMPNLQPPITNTEQAEAYKQRIVANTPPNSTFTPLMTLYLTDNTPASEIESAHPSGFVYGAKLYPAGATTNSDSGVTDVNKIAEAIEAMEALGMPLLVHGEVTQTDIDIFDREAVFIDTILKPLKQKFPKLKLILEHITTEEAVRFVENSDSTVAATITAHHLLYNRNHMLAGGIKPHYYCLPILKRNRHQQALISAAISGNPKFFLGTDSAPHTQLAKESACGCAGCYTAPTAIELYAEVFDTHNALDKLEGFASFFGPDFYGLPRNTQTLTLVRKPWTVPASLDMAGETVIPLRANEELAWQIAN